MTTDNYECIHRIKYIHRKGHTRKDPDTRAMLSERFKTMYRQLGLDRTEAAKFLRVSERTLHNWESGKHEIPYSAYKLLRLQTYQELPGTAWRGWSFSAGCLWSPEGHAFKPADSAWWSLLCRRADGFGKLYDENRRLQQTLRNASKVMIAEPLEVVRQCRQSPAPAGELPDVSQPAGLDVPVTRLISPLKRKNPENNGPTVQPVSVKNDTLSHPAKSSQVRDSACNTSLYSAPAEKPPEVKVPVTLHFSLKNETFRPKPRCLTPRQSRPKAAPCGTLKGTKNGKEGGGNV